MSIDFFNAEKILRLTAVTENSIDVADSILQNDVRIFPTLANIKVENLGDLWEIRFPTAMSTYSLYTYALYPVSYLLNAFEAAGETRYVDAALDLANNFLSWEASECKNINNKRTKILFGDHAVSNRTQCLCYLAACLSFSGREIPEKIKCALLDYGDYLADINNYSHYNHGLMMDLSLLGLLNLLEGIGIRYPADLKGNLLSRLDHSITRDLTEEGVHIENSPGYHFWMLGFLGKIVNPLSHLDKKLYLKASDALRKASEYASYITRPDGSVPPIGDTHAGVMFKPSTGLSSKVFQDANQVIFRSPDDSVWAHFGCGYKTHVHKHCDNGAFNLYYGGRDILIDPGFLNYENSDDSMEIRSTYFHNTVRPKGREQSIVRLNLSESDKSYKPNLSRSRIIGYKDYGAIEASLARISDYDGVDVDRLVVWIKPNIFFIFDKASRSSELLEQVFHTSPSLNAEVGAGFISLLGSANEEICKLTQYGKNERKIDPKRKKDILAPSFIAEKFNTKQCSQRITLESTDFFLTSIELARATEASANIERVDGLSVQYKLFGEINELELAKLKSDLFFR